MICQQAQYDSKMLSEEKGLHKNGIKQIHMLSNVEWDGGMLTRDEYEGMRMQENLDSTSANHIM